MDQKSTKSKCKSNINAVQTRSHETIPENLFDVLPFRDYDIANKEESKPYIVTTYLPNGIFHQMKKACSKAGINLVTRPGPKLKDILCGANKTRHDQHKKPGVYKIHCPCSPNAIYVGQTIRPISTRGKEHERAALKGNWQHSGITQHKETCHENVSWKPDIITNLTNKNKRKLTYDLKIREALEIRRHNSGPGRGLNEDMGAYVKTTMWNPVFHKMRSDDAGRGGTNP